MKTIYLIVSIGLVFAFISILVHSEEQDRSAKQAKESDITQYVSPSLRSDGDAKQANSKKPQGYNPATLQEDEVQNDSMEVTQSVPEQQPDTLELIKGMLEERIKNTEPPTNLNAVHEYNATEKLELLQKIKENLSNNH